MYNSPSVPSACISRVPVFWSNAKSERTHRYLFVILVVHHQYPGQPFLLLGGFCPGELSVFSEKWSGWPRFQSWKVLFKFSETVNFSRCLENEVWVTPCKLWLMSIGHHMCEGAGWDRCSVSLLVGYTFCKCCTRSNLAHTAGAPSSLSQDWIQQNTMLYLGCLLPNFSWYGPGLLPCVLCVGFSVRYRMANSVVWDLQNHDATDLPSPAGHGTILPANIMIRQIKHTLWEP